MYSFIFRNEMEIKRTWTNGYMTNYWEMSTMEWAHHWILFVCFRIRRFFEFFPEISSWYFFLPSKMSPHCFSARLSLRFIHIVWLINHHSSVVLHGSVTDYVLLQHHLLFFSPAIDDNSHPKKSYFELSKYEKRQDNCLENSGKVI